jgi:hypothetical protein
MIRSVRVISEFLQKSARRIWISTMAFREKKPRRAMTEPDLRKYADCLMSVAEEQPQENNHRDRHAEQPEQKSSSHVRLHEFLMD